MDDGNLQMSLDAAIRDAAALQERLTKIRATLAGGEEVVVKGQEIMDWWNALAKELGLPTVRAWTKTRQTHLKARSGTDLWNLAEIESQVRTLKPFAFEGWFGLDWFLKSENNLAKLLEGNYSEDPDRKPRITVKDVERGVDDMLGGSFLNDSSGS